MEFAGNEYIYLSKLKKRENKKVERKNSKSPHYQQAKAKSQ
jgi:hypothetical protein